MYPLGSRVLNFYYNSRFLNLYSWFAITFFVLFIAKMQKTTFFIVVLILSWNLNSISKSVEDHISHQTFELIVYMPVFLKQISHFSIGLVLSIFTVKRNRIINITINSRSKINFSYCNIFISNQYNIPSFKRKLADSDIPRLGEFVSVTF